MRFTFALLAIPALVAAVPTGRRCLGTISSLEDVAAAQKCPFININAFTVPAGKTFALSLSSGTLVNMLGDVKFGVANWAGPLFSISGTSIIFNGNNHTFDGQGLSYWDGLGGNGGCVKPHPMMKIKMSGMYRNVKVLNSPAHTYSVSNPAPLTMSKLIIDNSAGNAKNSKSGDKAAGHNTDGFDVSTTDLTIEDCTVYNQDDCLALNKGSNIVFQRNTCSGGHGISIGSISTNANVKNVAIRNNIIIDNDQALRIKTKADATHASVTGVTFSDNTATGTKRFGVIIDQSYPTTLGKPGNNVVISDIVFTGNNTISVVDDAQRVAVNCGKGCTGTWDFAGLNLFGGKSGKINYKGVQGGHL